MWYLLSPRVWIAILAVLVVAVTNYMAFRAGKGVVRAEWNKEKVVQLEVARKQEAAFRAKEQQLLKSKQESEARYVELKKRFERSAAGAQSELGRLRDELATAGRQTPANPTTTPGADGRAGLERQLLGACAETLVRMAAEADGLEARIVGLQGYVRNVCMQAK